MFIPTTADILGGGGGGGNLNGAVISVPARASSSTTGIQTGTAALAINVDRASWSITNLSTNKLYVRMGAGASATNFDVVLVGCQVAGDGYGGSYSDNVYTGVVTVFVTGLSYNVAERSFDSIITGSGNAIPTVSDTFDYRAASSSTPAISSDPTALAANGARKSWSIVNMGTNLLYVRFGAACTVSPVNYDQILLGGQVNDDGYGASYGDRVYTGVVTVAGTNPRYLATERY